MRRKPKRLSGPGRPNTNSDPRSLLKLNGRTQVVQQSETFHTTHFLASCLTAVATRGPKRLAAPGPAGFPCRRFRFTVERMVSSQRFEPLQFCIFMHRVDFDSEMLRTETTWTDDSLLCYERLTAWVVRFSVCAGEPSTETWINTRQTESY